MKLIIASPSFQCPYIVMPKISGSLLVPTSFSLKNRGEIMNYKIVSGLNLIKARNFLRFHDFDKSFQRGDAIKRCCCDGGLGEEPFEFCCTISEKSLPLSSRKKDSKFPSHFDLLEPAMLGIDPDPPNWPERQSIMWANLEQKANSFGLPLSLRMLKKKLQLEVVGVRDLGESACCSVKKAFSSMVSIVVQLQTYALQMREVLCDEDLELIVAKAQREICASYVWLFQKVFSRTPALMIYIMILLANFSVYSASLNIAMADASLLGSVRVCEIESVFRLGKTPDVVPEEYSSVFADHQELRNETDIQLWNSIVDEVTEMQGLEEVGLDREVMQRFVSPLSVDVEPDHFVDYFKMDFLYQMMLFRDPYNTLLLCNYAQFLHLVAQDYDRAEECFKRAMQLEPPDAEVLSQYATFLWTVRKDLRMAEERYRQAVAVEPGNPYYASWYANFLWSTGVNSSYDNIKTLNS